MGEKKPTWWAERRQRRRFLEEQGLVGPPSFFRDRADWRAVVIGLLLLGLGALYTWISLHGSPEVSNTTATALDGNAAANRKADISHTFSSLNWAPGADLWIRWRDRAPSGNADGIAIDNVRFTAVPEPTGVAFVVAAGSVAGLLRRRRRVD